MPEKAKRFKLSNHRFGRVVKFKISGQSFYLQTGEYPDGRPGEIFISSYAEGSSYRSVLSAFARLFSIALQHGVPVEELINKFKGVQFEPRGIVQGVSGIKFAQSPIDCIVRILENIYLDDKSSIDNGDDIGYSKRDEREYVMDQIVDNHEKQEEHNHKKFTGETCTVCGSTQMVQSGTCQVCLNCGSTTGCA